MHESSGFLVGQRREQQSGRVQFPAAPGGPTIEQFRPRGAQDEQRHPRRPLDELVDEVEHRRVRPVEILEDEHGRTLVRERLQEAAPSGKGLLASVPAELAVAACANERSQVSADPAGISGLEKRLGHRTDLFAGDLCRVAFQDPGLRLHDLAERPEAHALAVGQRPATAPVDELVALLDRAVELVDEAALADPGHADQRQELWFALPLDPVERVDQRV